MTLAGFGFNRELTNVVHIQGTDDRVGKAVASQVWKEIQHWLTMASQQVPEQIVSMILRVRDFAPWLELQAPDRESDIRVLAGRPGAESLWLQLLKLIEGRAQEVLISGAFFDKRLQFLKRIQEDLQPSRLIVAVDPKTVQMPSQAKDASGITLVRADELGADESKKDEGNHYLHAKCLSVQLEQSLSVFVSGSANPSASAWLATNKSGNVELMLVRMGDGARTAMEETGFAAIPGMPLLNESDWAVIQENQPTDRPDEVHQIRTGVAAVEDGQIILSKDLVADLETSDLVLLDIDRQEIARSKGLTGNNGLYVAEFPGTKLAGAAVLRCVVGEELKAEFLLHFVQAVEEQARTGVQKRVKEALLSFETESPNFGLLIECIDKILFSSRSLRDPVKAPNRYQTTGVEIQEPQSLVIDISETKKRKAKQRMNHSGDLAYLLDALIYHLRFQEDKTIDKLDHYGRSEEEQVGADDKEDTEAARLAKQQRTEILDQCHSKVRTVISRMLKQLRAYVQEKQSLSNVLVRLLGVLAILRELRNCDGRVVWIDPGQTTVPLKQRLRLFEGVMLSLFEGKTSLLHLESLEEDFEHTDDVARLKGLLLWLAWDCGLAIKLKKPFMESPEDLNERIKRNAMLLALAQTIRADEVVIDEARQSIGSQTSSELEWLKEIQGLARYCDAVKQDRSKLQPLKEAQPGDIAIHNRIENWDIRVVMRNRGDIIDLIRLNEKKDPMSYSSEYLTITRLYSIGGS